MSPSPTLFPSLASHLPPSDIFQGSLALASNLGAQAHLYRTAEEFVPFHLCSPAASREQPSPAAACVSRRAGQAPSQPLAARWKNLSRCGKPHEGAWVTEQPPGKVICCINAHYRTGCMSRGRKRRRKGGLRSSLNIFESSPGLATLSLQEGPLHFITSRNKCNGYSWFSVISCIVIGAGGILNARSFLAIP